jgi:hypothetical protein
MRAEDLEVLRRQMLAEISAATVLVSGVIGKAALDALLASTRRSRSPSLSR